MNNFTSTFFSENRKTLRSRLKNKAPIVMTANGYVQRAGDSAFPFRQDSNFWYLTGIELPEVILVITEDSEYLILPEREAIVDYFDGAIDQDGLSRISGIEKVYTHQEGWEQLQRLIKQQPLVNACLHQAYDSRHNLYLNPSKPRLLRWLKKLSSDIEFNDIRLDLTHMRMVKQPEEIAAIQKAVDITVEALTDTFKGKWHATYKDEQAIDAVVAYEFRKRGGRNAYPSIVAGGKRACTLHYVANNQPIEKSELLLIDAGAEYNNYAADITRMYTPSAFTKEQQSVYDATREAQEYVFSLLKPGADIRDINAKVTKHIGRYLKSQKLISSLDPNAIQAYFPHAISHHLGLDVHDAADYSVPLEAGMVITVEPGIYIADKSIGVRIEDDVLITKTGHKVLSSALPS